MRATYIDANGENEYGVEGIIRVDKDTGTIFLKVAEGDADGDSYRIYVPNHREELFKLAADIFAVLELTKDRERGYDGFSLNYASANDTGSREFGSVYDTTYGPTPGVVKYYG